MAAKKKTPKNKVRKKAVPKKKGRPPFEITKKVLDNVESLAAQGFKKKAIAKLLGIHVATFMEKQKDFPELNESFELGKLKGISVVASAVLKKAKEGDIAAAKYYLNNQGKDSEVGGWADKQEIDLSSNNRITLVLDKDDMNA